MAYHALTRRDLGIAVGIGLGTALLLSLVMVPAARAGLSPLPKPLGLAFAETLLGGAVPLWVGVGFHVAWVTFWSVVYVALFRDQLTFLNALTVALGLWALVQVVFFPVVGWGFFGLQEGPRLMVASLVPHALFALLVWLLSRWALAAPADAERARPQERRAA